MDICVINLDLGYEQCEGLNNLAKQKGQNLINELKNNINKSFGVWLGNGINEQYSINISQKVANMKDDVPNNFCFVINRGKAEYVKYVERFDLNSK